MNGIRTILAAAICMLLTMVSADQCRTEPFFLGATAGISRVQTEGADIWKDEYVIRINLCYQMNRRFAAGVTGGYNNWTPTNEGLVGASWDIRKPARFFDIYTSLRACLFARDDLPVDVYLLGGLGIAFITDAEVYTQPIVPDPPPPQRREILGDATVAEVVLGGGLNFEITSQLLLEIAPTYTFLSHEVGGEKTLDYYSVAIGILFRI